MIIIRQIPTKYLVFVWPSKTYKQVGSHYKKLDPDIKFINKILFLLITLLTISSCNTQKEFYKSGNLKSKGKVTEMQKMENGNFFIGRKYLPNWIILEWKTKPGMEFLSF